MTGPASHDRHGSNAGRGFRFQDAVAAWMAVRVWAGDDEPASIIPEGNDDIERREVSVWQGGIFMNLCRKFRIASYGCLLMLWLRRS